MQCSVSTEEKNDNYQHFHKIYLPWATGGEEMREFVEDIYVGVHEFKPQYRTHTRTKKFQRTHPKSIQDNMSSLKKRFKEELKKYED